ncbi:MAG: glutathione S-transferase [Pseudomonadota bacterium]
MSYRLLISEYAYSDDSMRGWLELDAFGIEFRPRYVPMFSDEYAHALITYAPAISLPVLFGETDREDDLIWAGSAAAEILAERHPSAGLWPEIMDMRETARALSASARTGFSSLQALPMNLHARYQGFVPSAAEQQDVDAVSRLWAWALASSGGPFLCGDDFCAADAAFAPIASRFVTYGLEMTDAVKAYVGAIYSHPAVRRWHACADAQLRRIDDLHRDLPSGSNNDWPRQPVWPAKPYSGGVVDAINEFCPYSGLPIVADSMAEIDGQIVGFCNQFCCRRGMADAESWPTVMAIMGRQARTPAVAAA